MSKSGAPNHRHLPYDIHLWEVVMCSRKERWGLYPVKNGQYIIANMILVLSNNMGIGFSARKVRIRLTVV